MTNNYMLNRQTKPANSWVYKLLLFLSFIWTSLYTATCMVTDNFYLGFGKLLDSANVSTVVLLILSEALVYWIIFEIIFYIYRWFLGFKIYSFIVPAEKLKIETRMFFCCRNLFYGLFVNACFVFPYLHSFLPLINLVVTMIVTLIYASHLNKTYAEPIVGHFVFKCFCYPIFVYEVLTVISQLWGVLA